MSRRALAWIVLGVVALHLAAFAFFGRMRALPKAPHTISPPNFGYREITRENSVTGEKTVIREFNVSTKLAPRPSPTPEARSNASHPF